MSADSRSAARSRGAREALLALSLANLWLFGVWGQILPSAMPATNLYHFASLPGRAHYLVAPGLVALLTTGFLVGAWALRRIPGRIAPAVLRGLFLLALVPPANAIREAIRRDSIVDALTAWLGTGGALVALATAGALTAFAVARHHRSVARAAAGAVLLLSPLALVTAVQSAWVYATFDDTAFRDGPAAPPLVREQAPGTRVVWILFDELDQEAAFDRRPADLALPEFDRLSAEALRATAAYPPSRATIWSIPALLAGVPLPAGTPARLGHADLMLGADPSGTPVRWSGLPSIFAEARALGAETALAGWYHPYCRVLADSLSRCYWQESFQRWRAADATAAAAAQLEWIALGLPLASRFFDRSASARDEHGAQFAAIFERARELARDPEIGLAFLHFPVPHMPCIQPRSPENAAACTYADNLALADRTLGALRRDMQAAGVWERSHVIVTSDHWWHGKERAGHRDVLPDVAAGSGAPAFDHRVPLLVKLAGAEAGAQYGGAFNTVLVHHLALALLREEVVDEGGVARFLDAHRDSYPPVFPTIAPSDRGAAPGA